MTEVEPCADRRIQSPKSRQVFPPETQHCMISLDVSYPVPISPHVPYSESGNLETLPPDLSVIDVE
jgi:hypothetical protein